MKKTITNKELNNFLNKDLIVVESDRASLLIDTDAFYIDASITRLTNAFEVSAYLGEDEIELTENQKDTIANLLDNAENKESEFSYDEQEYALSLIF